MSIKRLHRYISVVVAVLWLLQAVTGCLIVFRWDIDDAGVKGGRGPFDAVAMGRMLDELSTRPGIDVSSVWASNPAANRFTLSYSDHGHDRVRQIDGSGAGLRDRADADLWHGGIWDRLSDLHMDLMQGDAGRTFVGLSGLLLLTNLALGLKLAWPRAGMWLKALRPPKGRAPQAILYGWHRMVGLIIVVPALVVVLAGTCLAFDDPIAAVFKADVPTPHVAALPAGIGAIAPSRALQMALSAVPGARLSGFSFPGDHAYYRVRVRAPGEITRLWGMTTIYVAAADGRVLDIYDARRPHALPRMLLDTVYPLHTGQIGGFFGRLIVVLLGLCLIAMIGLGVSLWWVRRPRPRA